MLPLNGATRSDLKDISSYPIMEVSLNEWSNNTDFDDFSKTYHIKWSEGTILQNAVVNLTYDVDGSDLLLSEQITVDCNSLFFKQAGSSVNIIDGVIYVQVTGYRKTLFFTGGAEEFGFALRIIDY